MRLGTIPISSLQAFGNDVNRTFAVSAGHLPALCALLSPQGGLRVPEDLSVITLDSSPWSEAFEPALSVVSQPVRELGAIAASMLIERINGLSEPAREIQLPSTLMARDLTIPLGDRALTSSRL